MTFNDVINQVYGLSIAGYFNREKFTKDRFRRYVKKMFENPRVENLVAEIALNDGWWHFEIIRNKSYGWDYYIPDSRKGEEALKRKI